VLQTQPLILHLLKCRSLEVGLLISTSLLLAYDLLDLLLRNLLSPERGFEELYGVDSGPGGIEILHLLKLSLALLLDLITVLDLTNDPLILFFLVPEDVAPGVFVGFDASVEVDDTHLNHFRPLAFAPHSCCV